MEELKFVRLKLPNLIPRTLIEEIRGRPFSVDNFYEYQIKLVGHPLNFLFALVDEDKKIQGFLWAEKRLIENSIRVYSFSISKDYWQDAEALLFMSKFLEELKSKENAAKVIWESPNERIFKKKGFKRSNISLMEYNTEKIAS